MAAGVKNIPKSGAVYCLRIFYPENEGRSSLRNVS